LLAFYLGILLIGSNSCTQGVSSREKPLNESHETDESADDKEGDVLLVKSFLNWYRENYARVQQIQLVDFSSDGHYELQLDGMEEYLLILKNSGLFSESFVQNMKMYFEECDDRFKVTQQNDGPPVGFEADLLLHTQEPNAILEKQTTLDYNVIHQSESLKRVQLITLDNVLVFEFVKDTEQQFLIDSISFDKKE